jgi:pimeloyl-ACP methyl ester carboxylesterase
MIDSYEFKPQFDNRLILPTTFGTVQAVKQPTTLRAKAFEKAKHTGYSPVTVQAGTILSDAAIQRGLSLVTVGAHSAGSLVAEYLASKNPKSVREIGLAMPVGLSGTRNLVALAYGFWRYMHDSHLTGSFLQSNINSQQRINKGGFGPNALYGLAMGLAIANADIYQNLINLRSDGVGLGLYLHLEDPIVPYKSTTRYLRSKSRDHRFGFNYFARRHGGHDMYSDPQAMDVILQMFEKIKVTL